MTVQYWPETKTFSFSCLWGCFQGDFPTELAAEEAELTHECFPSAA